jgi:23S rRNA (cytidine1920-2'-O)/16S rRNA (cytidine1409-2'-O)-methyltransferase
MNDDTCSNKLRLDELLVQRGLYATRSRARDAAARGTVRVAGSVVQKPGQLLARDVELQLDDPARAYVSRAALKLIAGLDHFAITPSGLNTLDIGASTGGFTQVLLEREASHVFAIDVGHGQLHASLSTDSRITNLEGVNARELTRLHLNGNKIGMVVSDVSFISLELALPPALALAEPGSNCLLLVKPQFEAGRENIGGGGLLKPCVKAESIAEDLAKWLGSQPNWRSLGHCPSPIKGADGNREFLLAGIKDRS